jgi:hypothetical protein
VRCAREVVDSQIDLRECVGDVLSPIGVRVLSSVLKVRTVRGHCCFQYETTMLSCPVSVSASEWAVGC